MYRHGQEPVSRMSTICKDSVGIISQKTILKNHPFVEDVEEELKQLQKENEEKAQNSDVYQQIFNQQQNTNGNNDKALNKPGEQTVGGANEE